MIAILDYGSGNLRSAQRAFASTGEDVIVTSDHRTAVEAQGLVVPGVGAFASCMQGLLTINGDSIIRERLALERPTLGICVGMQILFESGTESSLSYPHGGLGIGIWAGTVNRMLAPVLPHMGWNTTTSSHGSTLFKGVENESFYFVHSYAATRSAGQKQAWSDYDQKFLAAVEDGAICATQFHPEKSGKAGLKLIENWIGSL